MVAWTKAMDTSEGEDQADDQIGCGLFKLIYSGWKIPEMITLLPRLEDGLPNNIKLSS